MGTLKNASQASFTRLNPVDIRALQAISRFSRRNGPLQYVRIEPRPGGSVAVATDGHTLAVTTLEARLPQAAMVDARRVQELDASRSGELPHETSQGPFPAWAEAVERYTGAARLESRVPAKALRRQARRAEQFVSAQTQRQRAVAPAALHATAAGLQVSYITATGTTRMSEAVGRAYTGRARHTPLRVGTLDRALRAFGPADVSIASSTPKGYTPAHLVSLASPDGAQMYIITAQAVERGPATLQQRYERAVRERGQIRKESPGRGR